jgi:excinuclease UvrABC nuclease subunit
MYVGKTKSLRRRFGEYLREKNQETGRPVILRLLNKYDGFIWFCFAPVPENAITAQENALLAAYRPPFNKQFPAQISPIQGAF